MNTNLEKNKIFRKFFPILKDHDQKGFTPLEKRHSLKGFTVIEMLVVLAIISVLMLITIPSVIRSRIIALDALAQNTLVVMSKATEIYYYDSEGAYPLSMTELTNSAPTYINTNYCDSAVTGFNYTCSNFVSGYTYTATPITINFTGSTIFTITTGGVLNSGGGSGAVPTP